MKDNPPSEPLFDKLVRTIATDQPRVTKFKINWDPETNTAAAEAGGATETTMSNGIEINEAIESKIDHAVSDQVPYFNAQDAEMSSCEDKLTKNQTSLLSY